MLGIVGPSHTNTTLWFGPQPPCIAALCAHVHRVHLSPTWPHIVQILLYCHPIPPLVPGALSQGSCTSAPSHTPRIPPDFAHSPVPPGPDCILPTITILVLRMSPTSLHLQEARAHHPPFTLWHLPWELHPPPPGPHLSRAPHMHPLSLSVLPPDTRRCLLAPSCSHFLLLVKSTHAECTAPLCSHGTAGTVWRLLGTGRCCNPWASMNPLNPHTNPITEVPLLSPSCGGGNGGPGGYV